jgi:hypothetical protein
MFYVQRYLIGMMLQINYLWTGWNHQPVINFGISAANMEQMENCKPQERGLSNQRNCEIKHNIILQ